MNGYGIRYRYGLFRQSFENGFQKETADRWLRFGDPWSVRREDERVRVDFKGQSVWAVPYDYPVIGYGGRTVNTMRLWQAEPMEDSGSICSMSRNMIRPMRKETGRKRFPRFCIPTTILTQASACV